ncbi:ADP-ribose pyrophosphatase YjhB (NUDIX family) [Saccharomonospora amisosensis]|uniref:ADP-ribose pyrophosphatase YjhB (NUDIX family) n=1 Tax=Saccharomonospora amisosensis TaxID=1128677 RepID=A0A7X5ZQM5_9PSEU|nr:NUDIX domain-containing protein [Saccharomonospora amisosensis]NIJ11621.1 ADP-ribose pyrophosphatase YjhB (NUDIX family) [Saccharomonospora amisosensis]
MNSLFTLLAVLSAVVVAVGLWLVATANRLDRLHVRMDAGWAALDAALARRAVVARTVAAGSLPRRQAQVVRAAAKEAESARRPERELAENELTRLLSEVDRRRLPAPLAEELSDAEQRVVIARRVYNDAVRDTLELRGRRHVRYFRLAGKAARPEYFEIAEPEPDTAGLSGGAAEKTIVRVVVADADGRVLLCHEPGPGGEAGAGFWAAAGCEVGEGEDLRAAAVRGLRVASGIEADVESLVGPVWRRSLRFSAGGRRHQGTEWFFLVHHAGETGDGADGPSRGVWWSQARLRETDETVYPTRLAELLPPLLESGWDGRPRSIP